MMRIGNSAAQSSRDAAGAPARHRRLVGRAAALSALVLGAALFGAAAPASAHNQVLDTVPAADSTVTEQPGTFSVTTSDAILDTDTGNAMIVSGPASDPLYYGEGCGVVDGGTLSLDAQLGEPGTYTVTWRAISVDSHVISESYDFEWAPGADVVLAEGAAQPSCAAASSSESGSETTSEAPDANNAGSEPAVALGDILWIGGAFVAVLAAVLVTLLVVRRKHEQ